MTNSLLSQILAMIPSHLSQILTIFGSVLGAGLSGFIGYRASSRSIAKTEEREKKKHLNDRVEMLYSKLHSLNALQKHICREMAHSPQIRNTREELISRVDELAIKMLKVLDDINSIYSFHFQEYNKDFFKEVSEQSESYILSMRSILNSVMFKQPEAKRTYATQTNAEDRIIKASDIVEEAISAKMAAIFSNRNEMVSIGLAGQKKDARLVTMHGKNILK